MPTDPTKQAQQILELPPGLSGAELATTVNDRIQQINLAFQRFLQNPALGPADLGQARIVNLADPKDDLDGVNLRTLKKFSGTGVAEQVTVGGSGIEQPTIYFAFDGLPLADQRSPFAPILQNRDGFAPVTVAVSAVGAPATTDCTVNVIVFGVGNLLAANLVLPVGSNGPIFTSALALPAAFHKGALLQGVIVAGGNASQVTIAVSLRGKAA